MEVRRETHALLAGPGDFDRRSIQCSAAKSIHAGGAAVVGEGPGYVVARHGIAKGDRVGIAMRNCPSWIVAYMAVLKAGGVATLLNGWWQAGVEVYGGPHMFSNAMSPIQIVE